MILAPSKGPNGIMLNNAKNELMKNPYCAIIATKPTGNKYHVTKNTTANTKFVTGPATEIILCWR